MNVRTRRGIGTRLRDARLKINKSREDVVKEYKSKTGRNITTGYLQKIEDGILVLSPKKAEGLATILKIEPRDLLPPANLQAGTDSDDVATYAEMLGRTIRQAREVKRYNLQETATKISAALGRYFVRQTLSHIELAVRVKPLKEDLLKAISTVLDLKIEDLLALNRGSFPYRTTDVCALGPTIIQVADLDLDVLQKVIDHCREKSIRLKTINELAMIYRAFEALSGFENRPKT